MFNDHLDIEILGQIVIVRFVENFGAIVFFFIEPAGQFGFFALLAIAEVAALFAGFFDGDDIADFDSDGRGAGFAAVDGEVAVVHELSGLGAGRSKT